MCVGQGKVAHSCHWPWLHQAVHASQVAETAQESRQLRERVADLTATNSVLVASIPNLSQRYKCARPAACRTPGPSASAKSGLPLSVNAHRAHNGPGGRCILKDHHALHADWQGRCSAQVLTVFLGKQAMMFRFAMPPQENLSPVGAPNQGGAGGERRAARGSAAAAGRAALSLPLRGER